jgi:hypothetical protein
MERARLAVEAEKARLEAETKQAELAMRKYEADQTAKTAKDTAEATAKAAEKPAEPAEPKEKQEPVVINVMPAAAPHVTVEPPVVNVAAPKRGKKRGKMTAPDGSTYTMETEDDD